MNTKEKRRFTWQDKLRLYIMIGSFFVVITMMYYFLQRSNEDAGSRIPVAVETPSKKTVQNPKLHPPPQSLNDNNTEEKQENNTNGMLEAVKKKELEIEEKMLDPDPPQPGTPDDYDEAISGIEDNMERKKIPLEPKALGYVLHKIRTTPHDAPERLNCPTVTQSDLGSDPGRWRGEWVRVVGNVYFEFYGPEKVEEPGPSGVYIVYSNYLMDKSSQLVKVLSVRNKPYLSKGTTLDIRGIFFKLNAMEARNGKWGALPVIITDKVAFYKPPEEKTSPWFYAVFIGAGLLTIVLVIILIVGGTKGLSRKSKRGPEKQRNSQQ